MDGWMDGWMDSAIWEGWFGGLMGLGWLVMVVMGRGRRLGEGGYRCWVRDVWLAGFCCLCRGAQGREWSTNICQSPIRKEIGSRKENRSTAKMIHRWEK